MQIDVIEGVHQYPIKRWLDKMGQKGLMHPTVIKEVMSDDTKKYEKCYEIASKLGFETLRYITVKRDENKKNIMGKIGNLQTNLCRIRIISKCIGEPTCRIHGIIKEEVYSLIEKLKNIQDYQIFISEDYDPKYSGTIISNEESLIAEIVKGQHLHLTQAGKKSIFTSKWIGYRMLYEFKNEEIRKVTWQSIMRIAVKNKYIFSPLDPPVFEKGYFEFIYDSKKRFFLTDYSLHKFWIQTNQGW